MTYDSRTEALREWNHLARENTENAIVSSMFEAISKASKPIDTFAAWLLVGAAAVASFLITNADRVFPLIIQSGFITCGAFLCFSGGFGSLAKWYALNCKISMDIGITVRKTFLEQLAKYAEQERNIKKGAEDWGINLQTGVRLERIMAEFYAPWPKWAVWLIKRQLKKVSGNPQAGHILLVRILNKQSIFAFLQAFMFLGFLVTGFIFVVIK